MPIASKCEVWWSVEKSLLPTLKFIFDLSRSKGDMAALFYLRTNSAEREDYLLSTECISGGSYGDTYVNTNRCIARGLGPFWLNLITKGVPHLKQSSPLLMFPPNLLGI
ncbi:hypothetical protein CFP56_034649 [Quercus suber]|uniref:Uncharacterized protein n=1 Tax=Quercus suber TaxID=58331 RepID=A0AAW0JC94_QUESU